MTLRFYGQLKIQQMIDRLVVEFEKKDISFSSKIKIKAIGEKSYPAHKHNNVNSIHLGHEEKI